MVSGAQTSKMISSTICATILRPRNSELIVTHFSLFLYNCERLELSSYILLGFLISQTSQPSENGLKSFNKAHKIATEPVTEWSRLSCYRYNHDLVYQVMCQCNRYVIIDPVKWFCDFSPYDVFAS